MSRLFPALNPSPMTGAGNNTYLLDGAEPTLVDAGIGSPGHIEALAAALADRPLARVIVTHGHADHASGVPALRARWPGLDACKFVVDDAAALGGWTMPSRRVVAAHGRTDRQRRRPHTRRRAHARARARSRVPVGRRRTIAVCGRHGGDRHHHHGSRRPRRRHARVSAVTATNAGAAAGSNLSGARTGHRTPGGAAGGVHRASPDARSPGASVYQEGHNAILPTW